jgi:hypothetical protein
VVPDLFEILVTPRFAASRDDPSRPFTNSTNLACSSRGGLLICSMTSAALMAQKYVFASSPASCGSKPAKPPNHVTGTTWQQCLVNPHDKEHLTHRGPCECHHKGQDELRGTEFFETKTH